MIYAGQWPSQRIEAVEIRMAAISRRLQHRPMTVLHCASSAERMTPIRFDASNLHKVLISVAIDRTR
jgi:hypothetical protein